MTEKDKTRVYDFCLGFLMFGIILVLTSKCADTIELRCEKICAEKKINQDLAFENAKIIGS